MYSIFLISRDFADRPEEETLVNLITMSALIHPMPKLVILQKTDEPPIMHFCQTVEVPLPPNANITGVCQKESPEVKHF
jgi:hypothetical protein